MMKAGNNRSVDIPTLIKNRDDLIAQLESRIDTLQKQDPSILNVENTEHKLYESFNQAQGRLRTASHANPAITREDINRQIKHLTESIDNLKPTPTSDLLNTAQALSYTALKVLTETASGINASIKAQGNSIVNVETPESNEGLRDQSSISSDIVREPTPEPLPDDESQDTSPNQLLKRAKEALLAGLSETFLSGHCEQNLTERYQYLINAANFAEKTTIVLLSTEDALQQKFTHCYTWFQSNEPLNDTPSSLSYSPVGSINSTHSNASVSSEDSSDEFVPLAHMELSYIATDGSVIKNITKNNRLDLHDFLEEKKIRWHTRRSSIEGVQVEGVQVPNNLIQTFVTDNDGDVPSPCNAILIELTKKLQLATVEVEFHRAQALLKSTLKSNVEYPECELYLMPIPEEKQSNYVNCYIWDGVRLVYIPPNADGKYESVNIINRSRLSRDPKISKLKKSAPQISLPLSHQDYLYLIHSNGGHSHCALKEREQQFKKAEDTLKEISDSNHTECDILYIKPNKREIKHNTLYIYRDKDVLQYTIRKGNRSSAVQSPKKNSTMDNFRAFFFTSQQKPVSPPQYLPQDLDEIDWIRGTLDLESNSNLMLHVNYAITHNTLLSDEQEQALWAAVFKQNNQMNPNDYNQKGPDYVTKIKNLTNTLAVASIQLQRYILLQSECIETGLGRAVKELKALINDEHLFRTLLHKNPRRHTISDYEESTRLFRTLQGPKDINVKRLAKAINIRTGELIDSSQDHLAGLPIHELPPILRVLNTPVILPIQYTKRRANISLMLLGIALISASIALILLSHGLSTPISYAGITLGTQLIANAMLITAASGTGIYAVGVFFGPRKIIPEQNDNMYAANETRRV